MFSDFKSTFPQVTIFSLKSIPINLNHATHSADLLRKTEYILKCKRNGVETNQLEAEIDIIVNQLYGLSETEVEVLKNINS